MKIIAYYWIKIIKNSLMGETNQLVLKFLEDIQKRTMWGIDLLNLEKQADSTA